MDRIKNEITARLRRRGGNNTIGVERIASDSRQGRNRRRRVKISKSAMVASCFPALPNTERNVGSMLPVVPLPVRPSVLATFHNDGQGIVTKQAWAFSSLPWLACLATRILPGFPAIASACLQVLQMAMAQDHIVCFQLLIGYRYYRYYR